MIKSKKYSGQFKYLSGRVIAVSNESKEKLSQSLENEPALVHPQYAGNPVVSFAMGKEKMPESVDINEQKNNLQTAQEFQESQETERPLIDAKYSSSPITRIASHIIGEDATKPISMNESSEKKHEQTSPFAPIIKILSNISIRSEKIENELKELKKEVEIAEKLIKTSEKVVQNMTIQTIEKQKTDDEALDKVIEEANKIDTSILENPNQGNNIQKGM